MEMGRMGGFINHAMNAKKSNYLLRPAFGCEVSWIAWRVLMAADSGIFVTSAKDFYLKEFETLRKEIGAALKDYRELERNAVIAVGATWAWLFAHKKEMPPWAW